MNIPKPVLQMMLHFALKNAGSVVAAPLEKVPHIQTIAKAYEEGKPLEEIITLYIQATENLEGVELGERVIEILDFIETDVPQIIMKFEHEPAKNVLAELFGSLAVPDFDDDPTNNRPVIDIINDTFKELAK